MKVAATPIEIPSWLPRFEEMGRIEYDNGCLEVRMQAADDGSELCIRFELVEAMGILDERDLMEFWPSCSGPDHCPFEIHDGGWLSQERLRGSCTADLMPDLREFLITSSWECVSVLSRGAPSVRVVSGA